jgi:uncharacterized phage protein (TIGR02220 family)
MARMSIDDMVQRDPRITKLSRLVGWSRRETVGCLVMDIWPICYDLRESVVAAELVDLAAGADGFAAAMVSSDLASWVRGNRKIRINGAQERIEYLDHKRKAGRVGGIKSAESRNKNSSTDTDGAQARGNPPSPVPPSASASVPSPVPVHSEEDSDTPTAVGPLELFKAKVDAATGDVGARRARKPKPSEPTPDERASALLVLDKLSGRNGVQYTGSSEHVRLISNQLRNGVTEADLRKVIGYCAIELEWADKPEMDVYLRPETLFGPKTIAKYLDPARTWFDKQGLELEAQPEGAVA